MKVARCPRCHRPRIVVGARHPRIRQHRPEARGTGLCAGSGHPLGPADVSDLSATPTTQPTEEHR